MKRKKIDSKCIENKKINKSSSPQPLSKSTVELKPNSSNLNTTKQALIENLNFPSEDDDRQYIVNTIYDNDDAQIVLKSTFKNNDNKNDCIKKNVHFDSAQIWKTSLDLGDLAEMKRQIIEYGRDVNEMNIDGM